MVRRNDTRTEFGGNFGSVVNQPAAGPFGGIDAALRDFELSSGENGIQNSTAITLVLGARVSPTSLFVLIDANGADRFVANVVDSSLTRRGSTVDVPVSAYGAACDDIAVVNAENGPNINMSGFRGVAVPFSDFAVTSSNANNVHAVVLTFAAGLDVVFVGVLSQPCPTPGSSTTTTTTTLSTTTTTTSTAIPTTTTTTASPTRTATTIPGTITTLPPTTTTTTTTTTPTATPTLTAMPTTLATAVTTTRRTQTPSVATPMPLSRSTLSTLPGTSSISSTSTSTSASASPSVPSETTAPSQSAALSGISETNSTLLLGDVSVSNMSLQDDDMWIYIVAPVIAVLLICCILLAVWLLLRKRGGDDRVDAMEKEYQSQSTVFDEVDQTRNSTYGRVDVASLAPRESVYDAPPEGFGHEYTKPGQQPPASRASIYGAAPI